MPTPLPDHVERALEGLKPVGDQWTALCPTHEDRNPSLTIRVNDEDKVIVHCHAGCDPLGILAVLGVESGSSGAEWTPYGDATAVYDYRDEAGKLLFQVLRTADKQFPQRRPDLASKSGWKWSLGDTRRVLFRLPELVAAVTEGRSVCICYSDDTEVLTRRGWQLFAKLDDGAEVAQFTPGAGVVAFVKPLARQVFDYSGVMVHMGARWSDLLVTPDHRALTRWATTRPVTIRAADVGRSRWLPVAGVKPDGQGEVTPAEARLLAAWQADGVNCARGYRVGWNLKKERKIGRLIGLLDRLGIAHREQVFSSCMEWTYVTVDRRDAPILARLVDKRFDWDILDWPLASREALLDELGFWDGDRPGREGVRFFTADERSAEVVSAVAATTGYGAIVHKDNRPSRPEQATQYVVSLVPRDWRQLGNEPTLEPYDGKVYCLTVPSGYLVTRRNGKTVISGNCEGEKDVLALVTKGKVATCNPGGAGKWRAEYAAHFIDAKVTIFADKDEPGRIHARTIAASLDGVAAEVWVCEAADPYKDIAAQLGAGVAISDVVITQSPGQVVVPDYSPDLHEILSLPEEPYDWVIPNLLEKADRVIITGGEGLGKSTILRQIAVQSAVGIHPFTLAPMPALRVLVIDCENSLKQSRRHLRGLAQAAERSGAQMAPGMYRMNCRPGGLDLTTSEDAERLLDRVRVNQPQLLIIGPLYRLHVGNPNDEEVARRVTVVLDAARGLTDCAVMLEAHSGHAEQVGKPRQLRPLGSSLYLRWP
jgi:AAA domain